jgi:hypothetical protein
MVVRHPNVSSPQPSRFPMWLETEADSRLWLVQQRQLELMQYAESGRLVRLDQLDSPSTCPDLDDGVRGRVSGMLVSAARVVDPRREPCGDPCGDRV